MLAPSKLDAARGRVGEMASSLRRNEAPGIRLEVGDSNLAHRALESTCVETATSNDNLFSLTVRLGMFDESIHEG
jgi:hypothetical protein